MSNSKVTIRLKSGRNKPLNRAHRLIYIVSLLFVVLLIIIAAVAVITSRQATAVVPGCINYAARESVENVLIPIHRRYRKVALTLEMEELFERFVAGSRDSDSCVNSPRYCYQSWRNRDLDSYIAFVLSAAATDCRAITDWDCSLSVEEANRLVFEYFGQEVDASISRYFRPEINGFLLEQLTNDSAYEARLVAAKESADGNDLVLVAQVRDVVNVCQGERHADCTCGEGESYILLKRQPDGRYTFAAELSRNIPNP